MGIQTTVIVASNPTWSLAHSLDLNLKPTPIRSILFTLNAPLYNTLSSLEGAN